jgi:long-chain acyl-CoA synthetase
METARRVSARENRTYVAALLMRYLSFSPLSPFPSLLDHLVAIGVPEPEVFAPLASTIMGKKISPTDINALQEACENPKVTSEVLKALVALARTEKLKGFEIPKALKLRAEPFSAENGLLTPTFKMKRPEARKLLAKDIEELYSQKPGEGAKL